LIAETSLPPSPVECPSNSFEGLNPNRASVTAPRLVTTGGAVPQKSVLIASLAVAQNGGSSRVGELPASVAKSIGVNAAST
jgi:hypothetical protein